MLHTVSRKMGVGIKPGKKWILRLNLYPPEIFEHEEKKITKTDIHRMPVEELRKLATEYGIENAEIMNGSEIKKIILNHLEM